MSVWPLLFLYAAALVANARVIPTEANVEVQLAEQISAKQGPVIVSRLAEIKKLSTQVQKARQKYVDSKKVQSVKPMPALLSTLPTETEDGALARRKVHRRSAPCSNVKDPSINTHTLPYGDELDVKWVGAPYEDHMLLLVGNVSPLNLYFSSDGGASYQLATGVTEEIRDVFISEVNASVIYALSAADEVKDKYLLFVSTNGGLSFVAVTVTEAFTELKLHPTRPDRFLALSPDTVQYSENDDDDPIDVSTVYAFENVTHYAALATANNKPALPMTLVDSDVLSVDFFRPSPEMMKCKASTVYYTKLVDPSFYDSQAVFMRSEHPYGLGAPEVLLKDAFNYEQVHQYIFVTQYLGDPMAGSLQLQVSTDMGVKFDVARFPFEGEARLYTIIDGTEDLSFVSVQKTVAQKLGNCLIVLKGTSPINVTAISADFTPAPNMTEPVSLAGGNNVYGCDQSDFTTASGKIMILARGGGCSFFQKVTNANNAGAVGVVIINHENEYTVMGVASEVEPVDYPAIPAFLVPSSDSNVLTSHMGSTALLVENEIEEEDLFDTAALYVSGPDGVHYTAVLEDVVDFGSFADNLVDVYKVESSNSTYIANFMVDGALVTAITFDKGSLWQRLAGDCEQQCNLTVSLSVSSSMFSIPGPRSAPETPGLILVNGYSSTTSQFEPELNEVDTFWSKDGGHTWNLVISGPHDYRVLDHGGVVVFIPFGEKTTDIFYSLYPADPVSFNVFKTEQMISGVVTEPGASTRTAFLYSLVNNQWNGVQLDFSSTLPQLCGDTDFEPFNNLYDGPSILIGQPACLDGQAVTYQHRKTCTLCYYGPNFKAQVSSTVCQCSFRDFQCYPGFVRAYPVDNYTSICARDIYYAIDGQCSPGQSVFDVPRYRIIPGDVCTPTAEQTSTLLAPRPFPCTIGASSVHHSPSMSKGLIAFLVLFVLGVSSVLVVIFALVVSPTLRNKFARGIGMGENQACCCSRMLAHLKIFRQQHNYQYSVLAQDEQRELAHTESDDDDMLFGIGDAQLVSK